MSAAFASFTSRNIPWRSMNSFQFNPSLPPTPLGAHCDLDTSAAIAATAPPPLPAAVGFSPPGCLLLLIGLRFLGLSALQLPSSCLSPTSCSCCCCISCSTADAKSASRRRAALPLLLLLMRFAVGDCCCFVRYLLLLGYLRQFVCGLKVHSAHK